MNKEQAVRLIKGKTIDANTRCVHYNSPVDIIAIRMKCCDTYFPCIFCHNEATNHLPQVWPLKEFNTKAVLCGACYYEMTVNEYLQSNYNCPKCNTAFNPKCSNHNYLYFEQ